MSSRVLHLSHSGLPDVRIEKEALTLRKANYELYFLGAHVKSFYLANSFVETIPIKFSIQAKAGLPPWWGALVRKVLRIVQRLKPRFIHAHDLIAGKLAVEVCRSLGIPFVYDGHEYWSKEVVFTYPTVTIRLSLIPISEPTRPY